MLYKWNNPPGWPTPPEGWLPPKGWYPRSDWPTPPWDWQYFVKTSDDDVWVELPEPEWLINIPVEDETGERGTTDNPPQSQGGQRFTPPLSNYEPSSSFMPKTKFPFVKIGIVLVVSIAVFFVFRHFTESKPPVPGVIKSIDRAKAAVAQTEVSNAAGFLKTAQSSGGSVLSVNPFTVKSEAGSEIRIGAPVGGAIFQKGRTPYMPGSPVGDSWCVEGDAGGDVIYSQTSSDARPQEGSCPS